MKRILFLIPVFIFAFSGVYFAVSFTPLTRGGRLPAHISENNELQRPQPFANDAKLFSEKNGLNTQFCFLLDMRIPSGQKRFFVYNLAQNAIIRAGLVAHGSCNYEYLPNAQFSNQPGCGCSAKGKYRVGYKYTGRFGTAYKLYGLDSTNSNAYGRYIVLHSYYLVPDDETYPLPICNSLGCAMVSKNFIQQLAAVIDASKKPVLLWIFN